MESPTALPTELVPIDQLFCSPTNPRHNDAAVPHVVASLRRFGWQQPIVARRSGEVVAAMAWDTGGWKLNGELPHIKFVAPKSGALGWIDTFAIPARGRNDAAAYAWINFNMRPEIAAKVAASAGNFSASKGADVLTQGKLKQQFQESFPQAAIDNIKWYPAVPAGIEDIEGKVLDRLKAGS